MFIKKVTKTNGSSKKKYTYLHLVESIRTPAGPRQRLILNLGQLDIDASQYHELSSRIEGILTGQNTLLPVDPDIEKLAQTFSKKIFDKKAEKINDNPSNDFQTVDVNSMEVSLPRSIGAEYICHSIWNELKLDDFLLDNGISPNRLPLVQSLVIGRLIEPGSENHTKKWAETRSALYELCGSPLYFSKNSYYYAGDSLFAVKEKLEEYLYKIEKVLFPLKEHLYFFDLTNTYFEGRCNGNPKAKYGRSKEKRRDCKLVTLGMIVDQFGSPKYSKLFNGNQSEPATLESMIAHLSKELSADDEKTIIMDAGIATSENLELLQEKGYKYIVVNRGKAPFDMDFSNMTTVREDKKKGVEVEVKAYENGDDIYVLCRSQGKRQKEESIRSRIEKLFLEQLDYIKSGLTRKGCTKNYLKIVESVGRLKEKYPKASKLYEIEVVPESGEEKLLKKINAVDILMKKKKDKHQKESDSEGSYVLRTNRKDLNAEEIWEIYALQNNIEKAFMNMKSHLGLRPNFHIKEERVDAHMFISVVAYHILNIIEKKLQQNGDVRTWASIRDIMSTQQRVTIEFQSLGHNNEIIHNQIRACTKLEAEQSEILETLGLPLIPLASCRLRKIRSDHKSP